MTGSITPEDVNRLVVFIERTITKWPGEFPGWPGNIELALIDTVLSIQARYSEDPAKGPQAALRRYKDASGRPAWDDLQNLSAMDADALLTTLANRQKTGGGRVTKAEAIVNAARRLTEVGVRHASDVDPDSVAQRDAYIGTYGLGPVTWPFFLMLLKHDGVKPDVLVERYVAKALGRSVNYEEIIFIVKEAAKRLDMTAAALDHAIWTYVNGRNGKLPDEG